MAARTLEMEFLPAALEVEQTPALPAARLMIWAIVLFFFVAIAWACVGRVDIVGVAPGKIVPSGRTKTIQPLERSVVVAIHVADGQHVRAGDVLVELNPTAPTADRDRLSDEQITYALDRARLIGLLAAVQPSVEALNSSTPLTRPLCRPCQARRPHPAQQTTRPSRRIPRRHGRRAGRSQTEAVRTRRRRSAHRAARCHPAAHHRRSRLQ